MRERLYAQGAQLSFYLLFFFFFNIFFLVFEKENCNHNVDNKLGPSSRLQTVK